MTTIEKAKRWFEMQGVTAYINDGSLYISVWERTLEHTFDVEVSSSEIEYRSDLYQSEINEGVIEAD